MNQTSIFQILLKKQAHNKQAATELFYYTTYKTAAVEPISKTKNPGMANDKSPNLINDDCSDCNHIYNTRQQTWELMGPLHQLGNKACYQWGCALWNRYDLTLMFIL